MFQCWLSSATVKVEQESGWEKSCTIVALGREAGGEKGANELMSYPGLN